MSSLAGRDCIVKKIDGEMATGEKGDARGTPCRVGTCVDCMGDGDVEGSSGLGTRRLTEDKEDTRFHSVTHQVSESDSDRLEHRTASGCDHSTDRINQSTIKVSRPRKEA